MEFTQLRDAKPATLTTVTSHWKKASRQMQSAESLAGTVSGLMAAGNWQGAAHDAAIESVSSRRTELTAGQSRADAVAKIIANGQQEAAAAKRKLDEVLAEVAEDEDLSVDDSGVVTAHYSNWLAEHVAPNLFDDWKKEAEAKAKALTGRISRAVAEATKVDKTAASAVRTAITASTDQFGEVKGSGFVGSIPGPQSSPAAVKKWWSGLSALQRGYLLNVQPDLIGRLNGVPAQYRDLANRKVLDDQIDAAQQKVTELEGKPWGTGVGAELVRAKDRLEALQLINQRLDAPGAEGNKERAYLLLLDRNGDGKGIVSIGNPDTADKVFTLVPGMTNELDNLPDAVKWTDKMVTDAQGETGGKHTAGIVYLGYDAPDLFNEASTPNQANQSAQDFARFQEGLRQTHIGPRSLNTVVGHSYGSLLVGTAARDHGMGQYIDQAVFIGSPGVGVDHVEQLGIDGDGDGKPDGKNVYASIAIADPIPPFYGVQPHDDAGIVQFGGNTFSSSSDHLISSHTGYGDDDQTGPNGARTNIARIVTGNGDEITNRDLPGVRGWSLHTHGEVSESKATGEFLGGSLTTAGNQTGQFLTDTGTYLGDQVKSGGNEIAGDIKSVGNDSGDTVKSWGQKLSGSIISATNSIGQSIKDVSLPGPLHQFNQGVGDEVKELGKDLGGGVKSTADHMGNRIQHSGQDFGHRVKATGDDWGDQVKATGDRLGGGIKSTGQETGDKLEQYVKTEGEKLEQGLAAKAEKEFDTLRRKEGEAEDDLREILMDGRVGLELISHPFHGTK